jgi:hemolysin III
MGRFPVEPFNTASNLVFLAVIIYFTYKLWHSQRPHYFLKSIMPLFFIGYLGGTIYHATRSAEIWLLMDWVPIVLLCLACSIYFVFKSANRLWSRVVLIAVIVALYMIPRILPVPVGYRTSAGYIGTAVAVLLPIFIYLYRTKWQRARYLGFTILFFTLAVGCRTLDKKFDIDYLWMGTHWLWHMLGGIAVFWLIQYIYEDIEQQQRLHK